MRNLLTISAACEPSDYPVFIMLVCKENSFTKNFMHTVLKKENVLKCSSKRIEENMQGIVKEIFEVHIRFDQQMLTKFEM